MSFDNVDNKTFPPCILAIKKAVGCTSHDVIYQVRKITGVKKVGHAGTLDPFATGVLVIGVGRPATRVLADYVAKEKEYVATIRLDGVSNTLDLDGIVESVDIERIPDEHQVRAVLGQFRGTILQMPPAFSALKIKGRPAYKLARKGELVQLEPRPVEIRELELLGYKWPELVIRTVTGPGTYIRALARDIGEKLLTGGYLTALERTRVGDFAISACLTIDQLHEKVNNLTIPVSEYATIVKIGPH